MAIASVKASNPTTKRVSVPPPTALRPLPKAYLLKDMSLRSIDESDWVAAWRGGEDAVRVLTEAVHPDVWRSFSVKTVRAVVVRGRGVSPVDAKPWLSVVGSQQHASPRYFARSWGWMASLSNGWSHRNLGRSAI